MRRCRRRLGRRCGRCAGVGDVAATVSRRRSRSRWATCTAPPPPRSTAPFTTWRSSRMLPRHGSAASRASASGASDGTSARPSSRPLRRRSAPPTSARPRAAAERRQFDSPARAAGSTGPREATFAAHALEVLVRRGDDAHVDAHLPSAADRHHQAVLQHAQDLRLQSSAMSPISSRKIVPPCASSKWPRRACRAPVTRPSRAQQHALHQLLGDRRTVDRHERSLAAPRQVVQRTRDHFLAGARLAAQQHRVVGGRVELDAFDDLGERRAVRRQGPVVRRRHRPVEQALHSTRLRAPSPGCAHRTRRVAGPRPTAPPRRACSRRR